MTVDVVNKTTHRIKRSHISAIANYVLRNKMIYGTVYITFVNKAEIKRLNRSYRKKNYATDVLSFRYSDQEIFGDVIVCLDVARDYAKQVGLPFIDEVEVLVIHGLLHLLGYDHETSLEAQKMESEERRIHRLLQCKQLR